MGAPISLSDLKTLLIPALVSLIVFLLLTYLVIPLWRHYHQRYSQYLPVDSISTHTLNLRQRFSSAYSGLLVRAVRQRNMGNEVVIVGDDTASDDGFISEDGEELADVNASSWSSGGRSTRRSETTDSDRRLGRDLEEGFRSESDDEEPPRGQGVRL